MDMMSVKTGFKMYFTLSNSMDIGISSEVPIVKYHYSLETLFVWGQKGVVGVWDSILNILVLSFCSVDLLCFLKVVLLCFYLFLNYICSGICSLWNFHYISNNF